LDQTNAVVSILEDLREEDLASTAIVLADESLLRPLLHRLPEKIKKVNVTMGLTLRHSLFADWITQWIALFEKRRPVQKDSFWPVRDLKALLKHPFTRMAGLKLTLETSDEFISGNELARKDPLLSMILNPPLINGKIQAEEIGMLFEALEQRLMIPELEFETRLALKGCRIIQETVKQINQLGNLPDMNLRSFDYLLQGGLRSSKLSIVGEPLEGLQIMGLLEARALGFDRIILCSANEEILPGTSYTESLLPFEIRSYYGLPGKREREAVYTYQFYRLLQHASHFHAIYHTDTDSLQGGEISRYLLQLEYQVQPEAKGNLKLVKSHTSLNHEELNLDRNLRKSISRIEKIKKRITSKGISASFINRYLESPLEWYYEYILRLKEPEADEIDHAEFGTAVHKALENLYQPHLKKILTKAMIEEMESRMAEELETAFLRETTAKTVKEGIQRIHFETALSMIRAFLRQEKRRLDSGEIFSVIELEKVLRRNLLIDFNGKELIIPVIGYADRVEEANGKLRLVDYKTGKVQSSDLSIKDFSVESLKKGKALQLAMYRWLAENEADGEIECQIISLPSPRQDDLFLTANDTEEGFVASLSSILLEMLDADHELSYNPEFR
jgi:RecB family exonuclease